MGRPIQSKNRIEKLSVDARQRGTYRPYAYGKKEGRGREYLVNTGASARVLALFSTNFFSFQSEVH